MLKKLFLKNLQTKTFDTADDQAKKLWVQKLAILEKIDQDKEYVDKAKKALEDGMQQIKPKESDLSAYMFLRRKYKHLFKENNSELVNPSAEDVCMMDSISLDEVKEMAEDRKKTVFKNYFHSIISIYRAERSGNLSGQTSRPLNESRTPTNDFIDDLPVDHNPFDDVGTD